MVVSIKNNRAKRIAIECNCLLFLYNTKRPFRSSPLYLGAIWAARVAMRSSCVVARGNVYEATPRGTLVYTGENYSEVGPPPNYTIHLVPILRRLYYIALRRILAANAFLAARLFLAPASNLISPRILRNCEFRNFCYKLSSREKKTRGTAHWRNCHNCNYIEVSRVKN